MSNINPDHYKMAGGREAYEVIGDVCDTLESRGVAGAEIYYVGSALKYLLRYGAKGDADEQIRKAIRFLQMALPEEEGEDGDLTIACESENTHQVTFSSAGCLTGRHSVDEGPRAYHGVFPPKSAYGGLHGDPEGFGGSDFGDFDE